MGGIVQNIEWFSAWSSLNLNQRTGYLSFIALNLKLSENKMCYALSLMLHPCSAKFEQLSNDISKQNPLIQVLDAALVQISFNVPCCLIGNIKGQSRPTSKKYILKKQNRNRLKCSTFDVYRECVYDTEVSFRANIVTILSTLRCSVHFIITYSTLL